MLWHCLLHGHLLTTDRFGACSGKHTEVDHPLVEMNGRLEVKGRLFGLAQPFQRGSEQYRVRMIVASFLVKDLHLHWTRGARHFMRYLACAERTASDGDASLTV